MTYTVLQQPYPRAVVSTNSRAAAQRIARTFSGAVVVGHADGRVRGSAHFNRGRVVQVWPPGEVADMCLRRGLRVHGYCPLPDFPLADGWGRRGAR